MHMARAAFKVVGSQSRATQHTTQADIFSLAQHDTQHPAHYAPRVAENTPTLEWCQSLLCTLLKRSHCLEHVAEMDDAHDPITLYCQKISESFCCYGYVASTLPSYTVTPAGGRTSHQCVEFCSQPYCSRKAASVWRHTGWSPGPYKGKQTRCRNRGSWQ